MEAKSQVFQTDWPLGWEGKSHDIRFWRQLLLNYWQLKGHHLIDSNWFNGYNKTRQCVHNNKKIYKEHYSTDINYGADVYLSTKSDILFVTKRYNKSSRTNKIYKVTARFMSKSLLLAVAFRH